MSTLAAMNAFGLRQTGFGSAGALPWVPWGTHIMHISTDIEEFYSTAIDYFAAGFASNEVAVCVANGDPQELQRGFVQRCPVLQEEAERGRFLMIESAQVYDLDEGVADPEGVFARYDQLYSKIMSNPEVSGVRLITRARLLRSVSLKMLLKYEKSAGQYLKSKKAIAICSYDREDLTSDGARELLAAHHIGHIPNKSVLIPS